MSARCVGTTDLGHYHHWALEALYRLLLIASLHGGSVSTGWAPHYAENVMAQVARNRAMQPAACMVSRPRGPIGGWVWIYGLNTDNLERCLVVDVSAPKDYQRHIRTRRVIELGYNEAVRMCGRNHMKDPPTKCPVLVIGTP